MLCRHLLPILLGGLLLTGCQLGGSDNLFDDEDGFRLALATLKGKIGGPVRVLHIEIQPDYVSIKAQEATNPKHVNEWRVQRLKAARVVWDRFSGPSPVSVDLVNSDLEANLFDLDGVDFGAMGKLMRASIERAALEDPGHVSRMEIVRPTSILPAPASGDVRWSVRVTSGRESATIFATQKGAIYRADLGGTDRARTVNVPRHPEIKAYLP